MSILSFDGPIRSLSNIDPCKRNDLWAQHAQIVAVLPACLQIFKREVVPMFKFIIFVFCVLCLPACPNQVAKRPAMRRHTKPGESIIPVLSV